VTDVDGARGPVELTTLTAAQGSITGNPQATVPGLVLPTAQYSTDRVYEVILNGDFNTTGNGYDLFLYDGTTSKRIGQSVPWAPLINNRVLYVPATAGMKTLEVQALAATSPATINVAATAAAPTYLMAQDIGSLTPATAIGLIGSAQLTVSSAGISTTVHYDELTVTVGLTKGSVYQVTLLQNYVFNSALWDVKVYTPAVGIEIFAQLGYEGVATFSTTFIAGVTGTYPVQVQYQRTSGTSALTRQGSATAPRQLWVKKISL
jgi:hypothetical protein